MYYYILEQPRGGAQSSKFRERLADLATDYGIAGEMVTQSALKSIDELIELGVTKGYTTVVAVGSDQHINRVVIALMQRKAAERPVLGAIPTDPNSLVGQTIGVDSLKSALETLKHRHLAYAPLLYVEPGRFLLTEATLTAPRPILVQIQVDEAEMEVSATQLTLSGDGHLEIRNREDEASGIKRSLSWLIGYSVTDNTTSLFHGQRIAIATAKGETFVGSNDVFAKTPFVAQLIRRALKMIVSRATLSAGSEK